MWIVQNFIEVLAENMKNIKKKNPKCLQAHWAEVIISNIWALLLYLNKIKVLLCLRFSNPFLTF